MGNPVIELIGAFVAIEALQRYPAGRPLLGNLQGTLLETGIFGIIGVQQLAPSLPYLSEAGGKIFDSAGKAALLLGAKGG